MYLLGLGLQGVVQDRGLLQLLAQLGHFLLVLLLQAPPLLVELRYVLIYKIYPDLACFLVIHFIKSLYEMNPR